MHLGVAAAIITSLAHAAPSGREIMKKNEETRQLGSMKADATLATGPLGSNLEKVKAFTWNRKLQKDGVRYFTLTRFHSPAEVRDEAILFLEHENDRNEVMIYLPSFKKVRRVEAQLQSESFMGSAFSYADIATPHAEDYDSKLVREEKCPGESDDQRCFVVEAVPATEEVRERTGYSKVLVWFRQDNFMSPYGEYFDLEGTLAKKLRQSEFKIVDPGKKKWLAHRVHIENLKNKKHTVLEFKKVQVGAELPDSMFTQAALGRGR